MKPFSSPLTLPRAAKALGISESTLQRWSFGDDPIFKQGEQFVRRFPQERAAKLFDIRSCVERMLALGYFVPQETIDSIANDS